MGNWLQWLEKRLGGGPGGKRRIKTFRWLILAGLAGISLMLFNSFITFTPIDEPDPGRSAPAVQQTFGKEKQPSPFADYEASYESEMKEILEKIVGVGRVDVMVTIDSTEEIVVEHNTKSTKQNTSEQDAQGAKRNVTDVTQSGEVVLYEVSGGQTPIILKKIKPHIRGILIVAGGAENLTVKSLIVQAVQRGLDVPPHRISVVPRKQ